MFSWLRTRRWQAAVTAALRPAHLHAERIRLGAELWARVVALVGARTSSDAISGAAAERVARAVDQLLDAPLVQASLALRYLETMQDRLRWADYEDVPPLHAEVRWLEHFLALRLRSPWVRAALASSPENALPSAESVYALVAAKIVTELEAASLAA